MDSLLANFSKFNSMVKQLFFFLTLLVVLGACKKMGCREVSAINFVEDAKKDDGSCIFEGTLTIWFSQFQSNNYATAGKTELQFFLNNVKVGATPITNFSTTVPTCTATNAFTEKIGTGKVSSQVFNLIIRDDQGDFMSQKTITISGNACTVVQVP